MPNGFLSRIFKQGFSIRRAAGIGLFHIYASNWWFYWYQTSSWRSWLSQDRSCWVTRHLNTFTLANVSRYGAGQTERYFSGCFAAETRYSCSKLLSAPTRPSQNLNEPSQNHSGRYEQETHVIDVQVPLPRFRHGRHRPARFRQHQQDQSPAPESRTREARHLSQQEDETDNSSKASTTTHKLLNTSCFRVTYT